MPYLTSAEQMRELEDTAFWLTYPGLLDSLSVSEAEISSGGGMTTEQVRTWVQTGMPDVD
ncbi:MAG: hypothetical protein LBI33_07715 [Propionibacteriaceae bacterium]|jgi:hypothetical protein|nr:hypothetical protein [Propionibacteriaceae bacterium]